MSITHHKPHKPWGGVVGLIRRHRDEDDRPTAELVPVTDESIHAWLNPPNTGPDDLGGVRLMPFTVHPAVSPSSPLLPVERSQVTVHRELDDDEQLTERLLRMEREAHALADVLAGENDTRMTLLLAASEAAVQRSARRVRWVAALFEPIASEVFRRRRARIAPLVPELAQLLASEDVDPTTAAAIIGLRAKYLSAAEQESQRIPKLTPELLARLDAEKAAEVVVHAPRCEYDGCIGHVAMPDPEGGYEVELPGCPRWLHFEASELEFTAREVSA